MCVQSSSSFVYSLSTFTVHNLKMVSLLLIGTLLLNATLCSSFISSNIKKPNKNKIGFPLFGDLQLLIHGTTNAFTTVTNNDILLYKLLSPIKHHTKAIGVYSSVDNSITPLCTLERGSTSYRKDTSQAALSADFLKKSGNLLRILSSDKKGDEFTIHEWIDSDVYVPLSTVNGSKAQSNDYEITTAVNEAVGSQSVEYIVWKLEQDVLQMEILLKNMKNRIRLMKNAH